MKLFVFFSTVIFLASPHSSKAQNLGVKFEDKLTWEQVVAKAKKEHKYILVDCYTTWCGPCKEMQQSVFPLKEVGNFFNRHFISIALQFDKTKADNAIVKQRYQDAQRLGDTYRISGYPTFLFFSPDGVLVHTFVGAVDYKHFIEAGKNALDPAKQAQGLMANWKNHRYDGAYLLRALKAAEDADKGALADSIGKDYLTVQKNPEITKANVSLLWPLFRHSGDVVFNFFCRNAVQIDRVMSARSVERRLGNILYTENIAPLFEQKKYPLEWGKIYQSVRSKYPNMDEKFEAEMRTNFELDVQHVVNVALFKHDAPLADWNAVSADLQQKFSNYDWGPTLTTLKRRYFPVRVNVDIAYDLDGYKGTAPDWEGIQDQLKMKYDSLFDYQQVLVYQRFRYETKHKNYAASDSLFAILLTKYRGKMSAIQVSTGDMNNLIWENIGKRNTRPELLKDAIGYMQASFDELGPEKAAKFPEDQDTYANLLYKAGDKDNAIKWERLAVANAIKEGASYVGDLRIYQSTLAAMEQGKPIQQD